MRIDILTLFPEMCCEVLRESVIGRARERGCVEINCRNIRDYTLDKHNRVDDSPYGGGTGMIMQVQPIYDCYESLCRDTGTRPHLIYLTPQGKTLTQKRVVELSKLDNIALLCGHYEGIDERVIEEIVDEEISIGDFVVTGGELPALMLADAVARMLPGVLANEDAFELESHFRPCSNILSTPALSNGTAKKCRPFCSRVTMRTSRSGAGNRALSAPIAADPICSKSGAEPKRSSVSLVFEE